MVSAPKGYLEPCSKFPGAKPTILEQGGLREHAVFAEI